MFLQFSTAFTFGDTIDILSEQGVRWVNERFFWMYI